MALRKCLWKWLAATSWFLMLFGIEEAFDNVCLLTKRYSIILALLAVCSIFWTAEEELSCQEAFRKGPSCKSAWTRGTKPQRASRTCWTFYSEREECSKCSFRCCICFLPFYMWSSVCKTQLFPLRHFAEVWDCLNNRDSQVKKLPICVVFNFRKFSWNNGWVFYRGDWKRGWSFLIRCGRCLSHYKMMIGIL